MWCVCPKLETSYMINIVLVNVSSPVGEDGQKVWNYIYKLKFQTKDISRKIEFWFQIPRQVTHIVFVSPLMCLQLMEPCLELIKLSDLYEHGLYNLSIIIRVALFLKKSFQNSYSSSQIQFIFNKRP